MLLGFFVYHIYRLAIIIDEVHKINLPGVIAICVLLLFEFFFTCVSTFDARKWHYLPLTKPKTPNDEDWLRPPAAVKRPKYAFCELQSRANNSVNRSRESEFNVPTNVSDSFATLIRLRQ